ncbi:YSIRK-type signal peptide-containing protein (plasmid) [Staphylococcus aureus]|uniref:YSIRK-type signal peptide-containing protein n=1 Tax=Staphylococcus aureus TaxID=1280 RepID=UPI001BFD84EC|nr:YSIRK-type signal peptide-containing protein [Staphylococcus aureus]MBT8158702.1 YSIRK-type signal peptide-containing protein [Staphylococcus aureus]
MENKNNRYSIRKFSVGVGSILIASFIMIFQNEAHASEKAIETPKNSNDLKFLKDAKFSSDSENLDIRLRPEYNVGNALVVRVDKVQKAYLFV